MPTSQTAQVASFDVGLPVTGTASPKDIVLKLRSKGLGGGKTSISIESAQDSASDATVSVQTSTDGSTPIATTAALHGQAITSEVIQPCVAKDYSINLRQGIDNYILVRGTAPKGARLVVQIRNSQTSFETDTW